jgi:hypothetical protein
LVWSGDPDAVNILKLAGDVSQSLNQATSPVSQLGLDNRVNLTCLTQGSFAL